MEEKAAKRTIVDVRRERAARRRQQRGLSAPVILLEAYLITTVLIFFFGPIQWHPPRPWKLALFLFVNYGGLWLGYRWGVKKARRAVRRGAQLGMIESRPAVMGLILFSMVFTIFTALVRLKSIRGDLGSVLATLLNPGEAYRQSQMMAELYRAGLGATANRSQYSWPFRITTVLSVFNGLYLSLALFYWSRMNFAYRALFFVSVCSAILFTMGIGAQSGLGFMLFAALPVAIHRLYFANRQAAVPKRTVQSRGGRPLSRLRVGAVVLTAVAVLVGTIMFFQADRQKASGRQTDLDAIMAAPFRDYSVPGTVRVTSGRLTFGIVMICFYVSHGYEGLALSMELPFEWTYGLGWSKALQVIVRDYLGGPDVFERSYLARNQQQTGWPALQWWSTIFPWVASDTTYYGTVLFMMLAGYLIGSSWSDVLITGNPIALALLAQMFILVFMFPANNALVQSLDGFFAFIGILLMYAVSRAAFRPLRKAGSLAATRRAPRVQVT